MAQAQESDLAPGKRWLVVAAVCALQEGVCGGLRMWVLCRVLIPTIRPRVGIISEFVLGEKVNPSSDNLVTGNLHSVDDPSIVPRGGGTSQCGQTVGAGLVIDGLANVGGISAASGQVGVRRVETLPRSRAGVGAEQVDRPDELAHADGTHGARPRVDRAAGIDAA